MRKVLQNLLAHVPGKKLSKDYERTADLSFVCWVYKESCNRLIQKHSPCYGLALRTASDFRSSYSGNQAGVSHDRPLVCHLLWQLASTMHGPDRSPSFPFDSAVIQVVNIGIVLQSLDMSSATMSRQLAAAVRSGAIMHGLQQIGFDIRSLQLVSMDGQPYGIAPAPAPAGTCSFSENKSS